MNVARIPMPDPSSSSSSSGARLLARFPAAVQAAHASFVAHRDLEAADHVVLAVLRDHLPADSPHRAAETLPDESRLVEDLGLDSLTIAEVVFFVEDLYRVRIPQNELEQLARVGDLRRYLRVRLGSDAG